MHFTLPIDCVPFVCLFCSIDFRCVDAYAVPANFLEIDVVNPMTTITAGKKRFTDYEVRMRVSTITFFASHKRHTDAGFFYLITHETR